MLAQYDVHCTAKKGLLLHDNVSQHSTAATTKAIRQLKLEFLPHLPFSPNLAPTKYHVFGALKKAYHGLRPLVMMKLRTQCTSGFNHDQKLSL